MQNAVDDGALNVEIARLPGARGGGGGGGGGVRVRHDGRRFSPLDVLGLCSVGLSTKQLSGKKSIGFMGIGFKAVYKRFAQVTVYDERWHFQFSEPRTQSSTENSFSWCVGEAAIRGAPPPPLTHPPPNTHNIG